MQAALPTERRLWPRRKKQIPVYVARLDTVEEEEPQRAWAVDRSPGGIRLLVRVALAEGALVLVRPVSASEDTPWVGLRVKNALLEEGLWALGCEFVLPTWDAFLLFS